MLMQPSKSGEPSATAAAAAAATQPPPAADGASPSALTAPLAEGEVVDEEDYDEEDEEADAAMAEAFERLIQAAFEMVQQGKPMEAEYVLTEGAKQAAEILGPDALELSALYDQLCVIRFLHDRVEEAAEAAKQALDILAIHDEGRFGPASAIAATRYASTLLASGDPQEAQLYTGRSIGSLENAMGMLAEIEAEDEEEAAELEETKEKFEIGLGEARYYHGLAQQAQNTTVQGVGEHYEEMQQGLEAMRAHLGDDSPLIAAALREHSRLTMAAMEADDLALAEALYLQDARLHMAAGGHFEHVALTLYQCGTLQYVMGKYEDAAQTLAQSLQIVRQHSEQAEEHMLTVQQRLGMVLALLGRFEEAKGMLHEVAPALLANLGDDNPATEELQFMLSMVGLREMEADGVTDPRRRGEHLAAMETHLKKLAGYGEDHMLVKKAKQLAEEARSSSSSSQ